MATTTTYSLEKPTVGGNENTWGGALNDNADKIDDLLDGTLAIKPNLDEGLWEVGGVAVTATAAELNILDGVTASTAELNILDGVTATTAELNQLDGNSFTADVVPSTDSTYDIGTTSSRWAQGWFDDVTSANTSDGTLSIPTTYVTNGSAKAWVNLNGTGTIALRDSLNISSVTDNATGSYTYSLTSAFSATDYSVSQGTVSPTYNNAYCSVAVAPAPATGGFTTRHFANNFGTTDDALYAYASCHGDLA